MWCWFIFRLFLGISALKNECDNELYYFSVWRGWTQKEGVCRFLQEVRLHEGLRRDEESWHLPECEVTSECSGDQCPKGLSWMVLASPVWVILAFLSCQFLAASPSELCCACDSARALLPDPDGFAVLVRNLTTSFVFLWSRFFLLLCGRVHVCMRVDVIEQL